MVSNIDCPEKGQPYSKVAKDFVLSEMAGQEVEIKEKNKDRYGRIVGFVLYSGKNLSEELLKRGLAWHYKHFSDDTYLAKLEREARASKIGLWGDPNPITPYQWRKQHTFR